MVVGLMLVAMAGGIVYASETVKEALVIQNVPPWDENVLPELLADLGIPFDIEPVSDVITLNLSAYCLIIIASDQTQEFYDMLQQLMSDLSRYVRAGGVLEFHCADDGWNDGLLHGTLPGGLEYNHAVSDPNHVVENMHPIVQGIPDSFEGDSASHGYFTNLPAGSRVITQDASGRPTTVEYGLGSGLVIATGVTLEWAVRKELAYEDLLSNMLLYAWRECSRPKVCQCPCPSVITVHWLGAVPGRLSATGLVKPGNFEVWSFQVTRRTYVNITTFIFEGDTLIYLYNEDWELIDTDNDCDTNIGSCIQRSLNPGTYHVLVLDYGTPEDYSYRYTIEIRG